jgi:hypothetical protein
MSSVGTLVRDPGVVWLPVLAAATTGATAILRGNLVTVDGGTHTARLPAAVGDRIVGIALSDADPDLLSVAVGCKGGYTMSAVPTAGQAALLNIGTPVDQDQTTWTTVTTTATAAKEVGWVVNPKPDALGNVEVAFYLF